MTYDDMPDKTTMRIVRARDVKVGDWLTGELWTFVVSKVFFESGERVCINAHLSGLDVGTREAPYVILCLGQWQPLRIHRPPPPEPEPAPGVFEAMQLVDEFREKFAAFMKRWGPKPQDWKSRLGRYQTHVQVPPSHGVPGEHGFLISHGLNTMDVSVVVLDDFRAPVTGSPLKGIATADPHHVTVKFEVAPEPQNFLIVVTG